AARGRHLSTRQLASGAPAGWHGGLALHLPDRARRRRGGVGGGAPARLLSLRGGPGGAGRPRSRGEAWRAAVDARRDGAGRRPEDRPWPPRATAPPVRRAAAHTPGQDGRPRRRDGTAGGARGGAAAYALPDDQR